jgi:formate dehydrogenase major subunit
MGKKANGVVSTELSRRDFLKVAGAGAAALTATDFAVRPARADAATAATTYHTTCPYCSASCGQLVAVDSVDGNGSGNGNVIDIYGDLLSPWNRGGLCAKGAGALQLAVNKRRVGAWADSVDPTFASDASSTYQNGLAYMRTGNGAWSKTTLHAAMDDIAGRMVTARGTINTNNGFNSRNVAFFGSSHMNNEPNYLYRKLIAQFGTTNTEHQARI